MQGQPDQGRRAFWLRHLHRWHWISSALCLVGMLLFAATGITLNHAAQIEATPTVTTRDGTLPAAVLGTLKGRERGPLPSELRDWLAATLGVSVGGEDAEWSGDEVYLALPRPGGDAWISVDRGDGAVRYERTDRGWISYLNDLHKGRHAGVAWSWFIDIFAVACLIFCITGLFLLQLYARNRPITWPTVGLGLVVPLLLAILFIH